MWIDIGWFFLALLWGWMIYIFCTGATDVGLAGLIGMCLVSVMIAIFTLQPLLE